MSNPIKDCVEELSKKELNKDEHVEVTKKNLLRLKKYIDKLFEGVDEEELSIEEKKQEFLDIYREELKANPKEALENTYFLSQYNSYKEIFNCSKTNKAKLRKLISEAKGMEAQAGNEQLTISLDTDEQAIISLREIFRRNPWCKERDLLEEVQSRKSNVSDILKKRLIKSIQRSALFLNEFGILDEYIEDANEKLKKLNLTEILLSKRYPLPDEYFDGKGNSIKYDEQKRCFIKYDENGNVVKDNEDLFKYEEDIEILDSFEEDYLMKLSPEDLFMMDMFWKCIYLKERLEISKAISTIEDLDLWYEMFDGKESNVIETHDEFIGDSIKKYDRQKDNFLNQQYEEIQEEKKKSRFFSRKKENKSKTVEKEIVSKEELENLSILTRDLLLQECTIISKLKAKDFSVRSWGVIDSEKVDTTEEGVLIAIDNENFRGTVVMAIPKQMLKAFFEIEEEKLPKYKNLDKIDESYSQIMATLYLPASNYFKRQVMKKYKENPSNQLYASLVGKKAKPTQGGEGR